MNGDGRGGGGDEDVKSEEQEGGRRIGVCGICFLHSFFVKYQTDNLTISGQGYIKGESVNEVVGRFIGVKKMVITDMELSMEILSLPSLKGTHQNSHLSLILLFYVSVELNTYIYNVQIFRRSR